MKSILNPYPHLCPSAFPTEDATHLSAGSTLVAPLAPPRHKAFPPVPGKSLPFFNGNSMEMWWDFHGILRGCLRGFLGDVWGFSWDFNRISMGFNRNSRVVLVGFHGDISALWQWVMEDMEGRLAWCISWVVEVGTWCWDDDCGASAEKKMERRHGICYHLCTNTYETSHELEIQASKHQMLRHAKRSVLVDLYPIASNHTIPFTKSQSHLNKEQTKLMHIADIPW